MIEVTNLCKRYGSVTALRDVSFKVEKGDIFGFIGPNGAGKTTTIRILATLLSATSGDARVCGLPVSGKPREVRKRIGYMPDTFGVYEEMIVWDYLEFFSAAYDVPRLKRKQVIHDVLELTDLGEKRSRVIGTLSRGMQQRLGLARVLVHDPEVLLLDEPASGLDPRARVEIRELIKELGRMGKTILISSHILHELGDLCNKVGIIEAGRLLHTGSVEQLEKSIGRAHGRLFETVVTERPEDAVKVIQGVEGVVSAEYHEPKIVVTFKADAREEWRVPEVLIKEGFRLVGFHEHVTNLEEVFMKVTKGTVS